MNALVHWLRAPQTLRSRVVRLIAVRGLVFATFATVLLVGQAMSVQPTAAVVGPSETDVPAWTTSDALANPDCVQADAWKAGAIPSAVIGYPAGTRASRRVDFATAWKVNHNAAETDDIWVTGICS